MPARAPEGLTKKNFVLVAKPYLDVYVIFFLPYYLFLCLTLKAHKIIMNKNVNPKKHLYEAATYITDKKLLRKKAAFTKSTHSDKKCRHEPYAIR